MSVSKIKYHLCLVCLLISTLEVNAQFDLNRFLNEAGDDEVLTPYKAQLDFLGEEKYNSPWIHRFEFRSRTNDLNLSQEDFRFRISPTNPAEVRANQEYFRVQERLSEIKYRLALNESLLDRYEHFLDWQYLLGLKELIKFQMSIIDDELNIYENSVNSLDFDYEDYLDKDKDKTMLDLDLKKIEHEISKSNFKMRHVFKYSGDIQNERAEIIPIQQIRTILEGVELGDSSHLKILEAEQELALEDIDIRLEKARDRRNIGYFQTELDTDRGQDINDHMGFQVAIRIPLSNPDRPDHQRSRFDLIEEQFDTEKEVKWLEIRRLETSLDLQHLLTQHEFLNAHLNRLKNRGIQTLGNNPLFVLKAMENRNRFQRSLLNLEFEIYETYLKYLDLYGLIIQPPLRNYLGNELDILE